jgi:hypothetical protein
MEGQEDKSWAKVAAAIGIWKAVKLTATWADGSG